MKKAQVQHMETIFVLFILVVIIFIGIIFFFQFFNKSLGEKQERFTDIDATILTDSIVSMPEFTCGKTSNCMDIFKIFAFQELDLESDPYYKKLFGNKEITLELIYPEPNTPTSTSLIPCSLPLPSDPKDCNQFTIFTPQNKPGLPKILESPAQIYYPKEDIRAIGVLRI